MDVSEADQLTRIADANGPRHRRLNGPAEGIAAFWKKRTPNYGG